jgi:hypothetical protein
MLFALAVVAGVVFAVAQFMHQHPTTGSGPGAPVTVQVNTPNPFGGQPSGGGDKTYVP